MRLVLLYHRIYTLDANPYGTLVSPKHFEEHLDFLTSFGEIVSLHDLLTRDDLKSGSNLISITFDDGYFDNFTIAAPILLRRNLPAAFFVVSGSIGSDREFWWDDFARVLPLLKASPLCSIASDISERLGVASPRDFCYFETRKLLYRYLKCSRAVERGRLLEIMRQHTGIEIHRRRDYRSMTAAEVKILGEAEQFTLGAHTTSHQSMSLLSSEEQLTDAVDCKAKIEEISGQPIWAFAFPHGVRYQDFDEKSTLALKCAGYRAGFCVAEQEVDCRAKFRVPRIFIRDEPGSCLAARLNSLIRTWADLRLERRRTEP